MTGRRVWWYFVAFFGFIALVNAVMVTLAIRTYSGIVTDHPYEKGLAYNQVIEAEEKQQALGWQSKMDYKNGQLHFTVYDKDNHPIAMEKAMAHITRPTQPGMDFTLELKGTETPLLFPANGLWEIRIDAVHTGVHYQKSKRIVIQ